MNYYILFTTYLGHEFIPSSDNLDFEGLLSTVILSSEDDPGGVDVDAMNIWNRG